ncbi:MAG: hypothetical protein RIT25_13 [Planctomycetota bacterium]|jgi:chemotaxis protein MotB
MQFRSTLILALLAVLPFLGSCTSRYQDLLRDRDAQIRELNGRLATLNSENDDLKRQNASLSGEMDNLRTKPQPVEANANKLAAELEGADVRYVRNRLSIGIDDSVTFDSGSTALKGSAHSLLKKVADVLARDYPDRRIYVEGHTDTDPITRTKDKFRSNRHLSVERADAVARYLIDSCNVSERRVAVVGYGQFDPKNSGSKAKNRRVEIVVGEQL